MSNPTEIISSRLTKPVNSGRKLAGLRGFASLFMCALTLWMLVCPRLGQAAGTLSDLSDHWSKDLVERAIQVGYVSGYPDGTFRPENNVTRAEFVKLLVEAVRLPEVDRELYQVFADTAGNWADEAGYIARAAKYGLFGPLWYGAYFEPDKTISRLEASIMTMVAYGRIYQAELGVGAGTLTFSDSTSIPEPQRGWVAQAASEGVITGYPDGTFLPGQALTRAEAVVVVQRVLDLMNHGTDSGIKLAINGKVQDSSAVALRDGVLYVPASEIYGSLGDTIVVFGFDNLRVFPGNGVFFYDLAAFEISPGASFAYMRSADSELPNEMERLSLLAPTYMREGDLMLPVAQVSSDGVLPYATGHFDAGANTLGITTDSTWPGNSLPNDLAGVRLSFGGDTPLRIVGPGDFASVDMPFLTSPSGRRINSSEPIEVSFSVSPSSPLRLVVANGDGSGGTGESLTSVKNMIGNPSSIYCTAIDASGGSQVEEGEFMVTASVPGMSPAQLTYSVEDRRPFEFQVAVAPSEDAGGEYTVVVTLLDSRGRVVDEYIREAQGSGPVLAIRSAAGTAIHAEPILIPDPTTGRAWITYAGETRYSFSWAGTGQCVFVVDYAGAHGIKVHTEKTLDLP